ncbi:unnamed protein product, partial [Brugia timori]|uniref:SH2 domain-containing protein n=1 Tax=Brugia timori TaxID=42155 RepID=A0A0R3QAC5_9BILA
MYTQNEEQWKETDDLGCSEYRRRVTHEDICNCDTSLRSSTSQDWRKSTDYCAGYNDYATIHPSNLWFQNDLRGRSRQRYCQNSNNCCNFCDCYCRNQQRYRKSRSEAIHNRRKRWNASDSMHQHSGQFMKSSENLRTIPIIPMRYTPTLSTKKSSNFQANNTINLDDNSIPITMTTTMTTTTTTMTTTTTTAPYYGPFLARKIRITPALIEKTRSFHECYSSERKYFNEIKTNDQCDNVIKHLSDVTTTNNKSAISDASPNIITKHICSEFDEIPLYATKNSNINNEMNSLSATNLSPLISIDKFEQITGRNTIMDENNYANGREALMEGLALLKYRMKEHEKRLTLSHQNNEMKLYSKKNSEIREYLHEKMQQFAIKKIANYWYKKTFKKNEQMEKFSQKLHPLVSIDKQKIHTDIMKIKSKNVENTTSNAIIDNSTTDNDNNDDSNQPEFITEIRQVREKLRKISDNSTLIVDNKNGTKNDIISINEGNYLIFFFSL